MHSAECARCVATRLLGQLVLEGQLHVVLRVAGVVHEGHLHRAARVSEAARSRRRRAGVLTKPSSEMSSRL
jgi:hypothetical protein